jgi:histidyl-tRNA synthetase
MNKITKFNSFENLDKIGEIPVYYGFQPIKSPTISKSDEDIAKSIDPENHGNNSNIINIRTDEKVAIVRMYQEKELFSQSQPVMLYFKDSIKGAKKNDNFLGQLEVLGTTSSISEATIIQCARIMLGEEGYKNTIVEINSIGDKDSLAKFTRELTSYYRKHINELTTEGRQLLKKGPFEVLTSDEPSCLEINKRAPNSINYLSESSKKHLEEVLEYLEAIEVPYFINNSLIGNRALCTETIFTILNADESSDKNKRNNILAIGGRYSGIAKKMNVKRDVPGCGISILVKAKNKDNKKPLTKMKKPIASFVQLSVESKLLSLKVIEILRKAKIPLHLSLSKDRLGAQVSSVERYHTPYVIVMGKKEAVENTVIVRHNDSHSQQIIKIEDLPKYMKDIENKYYKN